MDAAAERKRPGFLSGLRYPLRGARFVYFEHRGLARFWLPPILITGCALVAVTFVALHYRGDVVELLWSEPVGEGFFVSVKRVLHEFVEWVIAVLLMALGVVVVAMFTSIVAAPFNDALSEAVERIERGGSGASVTLGKLLRDLKRTVGLELLKLGSYVGVMLPLFIASLLVPVVGPALYTVIGFLLTALFLSIDYVDWPAARRELPLARRLAMARGNLAPMLGLGMGIWGLLFVPFINLFFMPAAVAGGTLMFLDLHDPKVPQDEVS